MFQEMFSILNNYKDNGISIVVIFFKRLDIGYQYL